MNFVITGLIVYFALELIAILLYTPRFSMWFKGYKKQPTLYNPNKAKFAVIIPARDESKAIGMLLGSINRQTYPKDKFDVHVIVDSESDPTIDMVKKDLQGAFVHVVKNQTRKAEALDGCLKKLIEEKKFEYDDIIIVDADCFLADNFLEEMNNALVSGAKVIIPRKSVKNWESKNKKNKNLMCNCGGMTYVGIDTMGNKEKNKKGQTLALCGQGMLINAELIKSWNGYPFRSLIEDYEVSVECMRHDYKQFYYEHAVLYSEEAISHKEFNKRRMRWLKGFAQVTKIYNKEVTEITFKQGKVKKENLMFLYGLVPIYMIFVIHGIGFAYFLVASIVLGAMGNPLWLTSLIFMFVVLGFCYIQLTIFSLLCVTQDKDINKMTKWDKVKFVLLYPLIMLEYAYIFIIAFMKTFDGTWEKIERIEI